MIEEIHKHEPERGTTMLKLNDFKEAQARIAPHIVRTPIIRVPGLDEALGCQVYLKPENLQYTGSFKIRGAMNRMLQLTDEQRQQGVVASSSGNHAIAVACAAKKLGCEAVIVLPTDVNPTKLMAAEDLGAKIVLTGKLSTERDRKVREFVKGEGKININPYEDRSAIAAAGTVALEILEDIPDVDVVVAPVGGGGMISGVGNAIKVLKPRVRVIGAEPEGAPRYTKSRAMGQPIWLEKVNTIADGTRTNHASEYCFPLIERYCDRLYTANDEDIKRAMKLLFTRAKMIVEPSATIPLAIILNKEFMPREDQKVCFVISGGNCDIELFKQLL